ncbi:MAG: hypothetical protein K2K88_06785, partial [Muribaculaceae bacterium]|nr:hypothetical protein [Muribaculaceae bacterium]
MEDKKRQEKLLHYLDIFEFSGSRDNNDDDIISDFVRMFSQKMAEHDDDMYQPNTVKDNLKAFLGDMLDRMESISRESGKETEMLTDFIEANDDNRLRMWNHVREYTAARYSPEQLDVAGFQIQIDNDGGSSVLRTFAKDWQRVLKNKIKQKQNATFVHEALLWEERLDDIRSNDYAVRREVSVICRKYPEIEELAQIIGRSIYNKTDEMDMVRTQYLPSSVSVNRSVEEIDGVTTGNNLERVIPSEFVYLADQSAQTIFYKRYATKELSQFISPGKNKPLKKRSRYLLPRLQYGPIIVSVDTSESMSGLSQNIANSMLYRLVEIARRANRRLFIITFSVRCRSYEVSPHDRWEDVAAFVSKHYTGGTNGEKMLNQSISTLR